MVCHEKDLYFTYLGKMLARELCDLTQNLGEQFYYMWTVEKQEGVNIINEEATKPSRFNQGSPFQVFKDKGLLQQVLFNNI